MPRRDGEDWLEGLPLGDDTGETQKSRTQLRDPRWWLTLLAAAAVIGMGWEAVAAVLGDGEFTVRTVFEDAAVALASVVLGTLVFAARRT